MVTDKSINFIHLNYNKKNTIRWKLLDKLVYSKIRERTGGRLRFFVSGGGALNKSIGEFFDGIGIYTIEGYGMTETSPVISVNLPEYNIYGSVGKPLVDNEAAGQPVEKPPKMVVFGRQVVGKLLAELA